MNAQLLPATPLAPAYMTVEHTEDEAVYHDAERWQLIGTGIERYLLKGAKRRSTIITLVFREKAQR